MTTELNPVTSSSKTSLQFSFTGNGIDLLLIILRNMLFTVFTLGFYYPWARTNVRKFLWHHTKINGIPLEYTGTGKELLKSYLIVVGSYTAFVICTGIFQENLTASLIINLGFVLAFFALIPYAILGSHAYKVTRTRYRGLYFHFDRTEKDSFARQSYLKIFLTYITFGIYGPFFMNYIHSFLIGNTSYGDEKFKFSGKGGDYFWIQFSNLIGIILTFGLFTPWATLRSLRYQISQTSIHDSNFKIDISGLQLAGIGLLYLFAVPLTLGLAYPFVQCYAYQRIMGSISLDGLVDFGEISAQQAKLNSAIGDAGADFLDLDMGL